MWILRGKSTWIYFCWRNRSVQKNLQVGKTYNKKFYVFGEKENKEIAKFGSEHGHAGSVKKFRKKVSDLYWKYYPTFPQEIQENLKEKTEANKEFALKVGQTQDSNLLFDVVLYSELRAVIISLRSTGGGENQHVNRGVFIGLVQFYTQSLAYVLTLKELNAR